MKPRTRPCPYCRYKLPLHRETYLCWQHGKKFRFDGRQFRRVKA